MIKYAEAHPPLPDCMLYDTDDEIRQATRCGCGCNVFRKLKEEDGVLYYVCNSCRRIVRGTKS